MPAAARYDRLDALRGAAIVWMVAFHFCFDLAHFGWIAADFRRDPFWTLQRTAIVSLFLLCAGLGQAVAQAQRQPVARFWRRWRQIAGCALLVSLGSWWMFPRSYIFFGVLHGMAAMLLAWRLTQRAGPWLWPLGALAIALPWFVAHPVFDSRWTAWVGLVTRKPVTEDYVPLLPWLGVFWWGAAAGRALLAHRPGWLAGPLAAPLQPLAGLGRWPLSIYMLHQPLLIGALLLAGLLRGAG
ncbi:heparan-alpha-glucosaminide N-acetyltransferase [Piscinibacter sakaiensis]|uniref:Mlr1315 protein n=1 Tax=Piscinibacter sakaiensis TaxID=1547922 RepID=A0A0K8P3B8_PISS1|nr:heparan-alpha-glucosaminide N-acetyltransferase [Piscinibacter sakaiensis]GAP37039.1 Mlr1315 protein [Piscinibacter sakaiensis]